MVEAPKPQLAGPDRSIELAAAGSIDRPDNRLFLASLAPIASKVWQRPWIRRLLNHLLPPQTVEAIQSAVSSVPANIPWFARLSNYSGGQNSVNTDQNDVTFY